MTEIGPMHGEYVLVTGGTGGIGLATATGLAGLGAPVGVVRTAPPRPRSRGSRAYFADRRAKQSSRSSHDLDLARRLWEVSAALVGVEPDRNRPEITKEQA